MQKVQSIIGTSPVSIANYPLRKTVTTDISFRPMEDVAGVPTPIYADIVNSLRDTGNLVFINPDGII